MSEGWNCVTGTCGVCDECRRWSKPGCSCAGTLDLTQGIHGSNGCLAPPPPPKKQKFKCCICGKEFEMEPYRWMPKKVPCNECLKDMVIP